MKKFLPAGFLLAAAVAAAVAAAISSAQADQAGPINFNNCYFTTSTTGSSAANMAVSPTVDAGGYQSILFAGGGTAGNVPVILQPAGSGYLAAALSNSLASGGNVRGQYSVDWQQARGAATQVASGPYATIPGGYYNTASGTASFAVGNTTTASGTNGVAMGQQSTDRGAYGKFMFSSNAAIGAQMGIQTLYASSVSAASRMTADGNTAGTANSLPIANNRAIGGMLIVTARNVSSGATAVWSLTVLYKNSASTVLLVSSGSALTPTTSDSGMSTATVTLAADNVNTGLAVTITPPTSTTISASAVFLGAEL